MPAKEASEEIVLVRKCYDAWGRRDLAELVAQTSDDCVYHIHVPTDVLPFAGRHEGKAAVQSVLSTIAREFDFLAFGVDWINGAGETVRARVVYYYNHPGTGDQLDGSFRHVFRIVDGKVRQLDEYHDVARLRAFLEMVKGMGRN